MADAASQEESPFAFTPQAGAADVTDQYYGEDYREYADAPAVYASQDGYIGTLAASEGYNGIEDYGGEQYGTDDAYAGYVYDPASGEYVYAGVNGATENYAGDVDESYVPLDEFDPPAPVSPFGDEAYWKQYGEDAMEAPGNDKYSDINTMGATDRQEALPSGPGEGRAAPTHEASTPTDPAATTTTTPTSPQGKQRKKKIKSKQERIQMRQAQLEEDEALKQATQSPETETIIGPTAPGTTFITQTSRRVETRSPTFLERERAKVRLRMRQLRAIRRKRMPLQVRILTATRSHLSPLETYFAVSVEAALSDIFWASMKGDLRRVRFLVEVEKISVVDSALDPWHMEQTPLHWAAKGGDAAVIQYLLQAGANPRSLDENGSLPLHLSCWAGHVDATLALLRVTDTKDLYVQDYDAALAPLDWAQIRGHTVLVKAIEQYEDAKWLPKFVDDLVRGIIRYKIKLFKEPPKSPTRGIQLQRGGGAAGGSAST